MQFDLRKARAFPMNSSATRALARELCSRAEPSSWLCHPEGGEAAGMAGTTSEPSRQRAFESSGSCPLIPDS
jgi:hypothetical protein